MAFRVSGVVVAWGTTVPTSQTTTVTIASLGLDLEVYEASLDLQRDQPQARTDKWTMDLGTITLSSYKRSQLLDSEYGQKKMLTIVAHEDTGSATTNRFTIFSADCVYLGAQIGATVNNVWKFDHVFKVMDTVEGTQPYPS
jgi:hypothetical protein